MKFVQLRSPFPYQLLPALQNRNAAVWFSILMLLVLYFIGQANIRRARFWVSHTFEVLETVQRLEFSILNAQSQLQAFAVNRETLTLVKHQQDIEIAQNSLASLVTLTADNPEQQQQLADFRPLLQQWLAQHQALVQKLQSGPSGQGSNPVSLPELNDVQAQLLIVRQTEKTLLQRRRQEADLYGLVVSAVLLIGIGLLAFLLWQAGHSRLRQQQIEESLNQRLEMIELEQDLSSHLLACRTSAEAYEILRSFLTYLLPDCAGAIYEINNSRDQMLPIVTFGHFTSSDLCSPRECWALRRGKEQSGQQTKFKLPCQLCQRIHLNDIPVEMVCLPLQAHEQTIGILHINQIATQQRTFISKVAGQIALPLAVLHLQSELEYLSFHDANTGVYNRRFLDEMLSRAIATAQHKNHVLAEGQPLYSVGVVFMDVDHFKRFNSDYGHEAGDRVLRILGSILKENTRAGEDVACRYGGEEFVLIMPGASEDVTWRKAEAIREMIQHRPTPGGQTITLSMGVATYPQNGGSAEEVLRAANLALLQAKAEGRNQTVMAR